jgi:predicted MFS family arabinose efflux permease
MLRLFRQRNFFLFWTGMTVSLLGDGIYFVAIAWLVYDLSNSPASLALVGVAWTVPQLACLLLAGAVTDRLDRRRVLVAANVVGGLAIGAIAALALAGSVQLWHVWALVVVYGVSVAFFIPAAGAIVPEIVPEELLVQANALRQFIRPLTLRLLGPALGGVLVASFGTGQALMLDALSFAVAAATLVFLRTAPRAKLEPGDGQSLLREMGDGFRFVRGQRWLWVSVAAMALWLLIYVGPMEVLIPYLVKNDIGGGAESLGFVFAAGGIGAMVSSLLVGRYGTRGESLALAYVVWACSSFALATLALAGSLWQAMLSAFCTFALVTAGDIIWVTRLQKRVPGELLGRVSSLDWLVSIALVPASFALVGPLAGAVGAGATLFAAGALGGVLVLAFLPLAVARPRRRTAQAALADA